MRFLALLLVSAFLTAPALAADTPTNLVVTGEVPGVRSAVQTPTPAQNYQIYIPRDIKSDGPAVTQTWTPSGYPGAGNQLTPFGLACAHDDDCQPPLVCLKRADSGQLPVKQCAFAPGN